LVEPFIHDLLATPMAIHVQADYVQRALQPRLAQHREDIALVGERCVVQGGVLAFSLADQPGRAYNTFIPYYPHPRVRYVVGVTRAQGGRLKLTVGYNPWL